MSASNSTRGTLAPRRRVIARAFAWASMNRRLARDVERAAETVRALVQTAMIKLMARQIARHRDVRVKFSGRPAPVPQFRHIAGLKT